MGTVRLNSLKIAIENKCKSIAFPLISSGIYGYPKDEALKVASYAIQDFLKDYDIDVTLVVFDKSSFMVSRELLGEVESYIDEHYIDKYQKKQRKLLDAERQALYEADEHTVKYKKTYVDATAKSLGEPVVPDDIIGNLDATFSQMLFRLIDARGMTDV